MLPTNQFVLCRSYKGNLSFCLANKMDTTCFKTDACDIIIFLKNLYILKVYHNSETLISPS